MESHRACYSIYSGSTMMYRDHREVFQWDVLKKDIAEFVAQCPNIQQVQSENQKPSGLLQEIQVVTWKWEDFNMDFIVGFHKT